MIKYLFWTLLLLGCNSDTDTDNNLKTSSLSDTAKTLTTEKESNNSEKKVKLFDNHQPFEIVSFTSALNNNTTDTDTLKCNSWTLAKQDIEKIIKNSEPIDGTTWDLSFSVLTCIKSVIVIQNEQQFTVEINAASFFSVNNGDTTVLFGDYKKSDRKYFIYGPDNN